MMPPYLNKVESASYYYGNLEYEENTDSWIIEGEPCVVEMAKRLFPGSCGRGQGKAKFKNTKRINGDLNWLMQRYPLIIKEKEIWNKSYKQVVEYVSKRDDFLAHPKKAVPSLEFRGTLKEFQKEGLAFLLHNRRTLLADEMGLGKTIEALSFLSATSDYPVLIVAPPHLISNWKNEIERFLDPPVEHGENINFLNSTNVHVIKGLKSYDLPKASVYIIHYLLLRGWKKYLPYFGFNTVIFDEVQELRHGKTEKYSAASLIAENVENCFGLSGTPIYNHGGEIWNVLNIIDYHCLGDWDSFTREWCYGYGNDVVRKPDLLNDYLKREGLMLRRTKKEVLSELPPKRRVVQTIDFDSGKYSQLIQNAIEKAKSIDFVEKNFDKGRLVREVVNEGRQAIGIAKAPYVAAFVKMLLEAEEKVLLFAYHHVAYDIYKKELKQYNPKMITGLESSKSKDDSVNAFMNDKANLLIISLRAGAGLNLQKATCVVFGELDWSPAVHSQCEDRAHRMGQKDSILCYYLVANEGTDEEIQEHLGLKVSQFVGIMGDKAESEEDKNISQNVATEHMNKIIEKLRSNVT